MTALIRAWEDWDVNHGSENYHLKEFRTDQVTLALAIVEVEFEFEHRNLHWYFIVFMLPVFSIHLRTILCRGSILLSRKNSTTLQFILLSWKKVTSQNFWIAHIQN